MTAFSQMKALRQRGQPSRSQERKNRARLRTQSCLDLLHHPSHPGLGDPGLDLRCPEGGRGTASPPASLPASPWLLFSSNVEVPMFGPQSVQLTKTKETKISPPLSLLMRRKAQTFLRCLLSSSTLCMAPTLFVTMFQDLNTSEGPGADVGPGERVGADAGLGAQAGC